MTLDVTLGGCQHNRWRPLRLIQSDGRQVVVQVCDDCQRKVKTLPKREWPADWELLDVYRDNRCWYCSGNGCTRCRIPCERCGSYRGAELHHWAPRYLFGSAADGWPQSFLCKACHDEWHRTVTPRMSERRATA